MCLSARDRRRGRRGDVPVCVCLIVFLVPKMDFHMPLRASHVDVGRICAKSVVSGCATVTFEAEVARRADRLLVPISGYRVPSLKLIAHPPLPSSGSANQLDRQTLHACANWLDPSLTPPLTLHGFASHHPKTIAYYYRQGSPRIGHRLSASRPTTTLCL